MMCCVVKQDHETFIKYYNILYAFPFNFLPC